jgi:hypothetical protein
MRTQELTAIELRSGDATRAGKQLGKDARLASGKGTFTVRRAEEAGFNKGERVPPLRTIEAKPTIKRDDQP